MSGQIQTPNPLKRICTTFKAGEGVERKIDTNIHITAIRNLLDLIPLVGSAVDVTWRDDVVRFKGEQNVDKETTIEREILMLFENIGTWVHGHVIPLMKVHEYEEWYNEPCAPSRKHYITVTDTVEGRATGWYEEERLRIEVYETTLSYNVSIDIRFYDIVMRESYAIPKGFKENASLIKTLKEWENLASDIIRLAIKKAKGEELSESEEDLLRGLAKGLKVVSQHEFW